MGEMLAGDWGTTNLRLWRVDDEGRVLARRQFPHFGVSLIGADEARRRFVEEIRPAMDAVGLPAALCGMVGSNLGWAPAPYVDDPLDVAALVAGVARLEAGGPVTVVPGVRDRGFDGRGDVMRGEETQLFGWLALDPAANRGDWLVCHPGTHAKWMRVEAGRLMCFATAMTGEMYAVLGAHSILRWNGEGRAGPEFDDGVDAAGDGGALAARLFSARGRQVGLGAAAESTASFVSGLLIGAEVAATPALLGADALEQVVLIGEASLCALYARALERRGRRSRWIDGEAAALAGLRAAAAAGV
ncbi:MAG TPA: 2-dehydro-3-deoxygalactonokinase [Caulobacteraceae bacterium]|jgi:2-dehydro-3-deoxygalactonokinase|nr:2-dehydro-3-deoxygalactonokinase [Caulobacteraceae bacterium]